ncbi:hypothetical protein F25303_548 [Fusarium sp. NRRL 25303]|nr:hypothetical protein F25303_548 [Fusarium sp. NRRL 25303]
MGNDSAIGDSLNMARLFQGQNSDCLMPKLTNEIIGPYSTIRSTSLTPCSANHRIGPECWPRLDYFWLLRSILFEEPWTSDIDDAQWQLNFGWDIDHWLLPSIESHEFDSLFDFNCYLGPCGEALDADLDSLAVQHQDTTNSQLALVTETLTTLNAMQEASLEPQKHLDSLNAPHSVPWHQPDLSPPLCNPSPSSNAPTSHSQSSSGYEKRPSQSSTSSPVSKDARLICDFCGQAFEDVDSLW